MKHNSLGENQKYLKRIFDKNKKKSRFFKNGPGIQYLLNMVQ